MQKCPSWNLQSSMSFVERKKTAQSILWVLKLHKVIARDIDLSRPQCCFLCCPGQAESQGRMVVLMLTMGLEEYTAMASSETLTFPVLYRLL